MSVVGVIAFLCCWFYWECAVYGCVIMRVKGRVRCISDKMVYVLFCKPLIYFSYRLQD